MRGENVKKRSVKVIKKKNTNLINDIRDDGIVDGVNNERLYFTAAYFIFRSFKYIPV